MGALSLQTVAPLLRNSGADRLAAADTLFPPRAGAAFCWLILSAGPYRRGGGESTLDVDDGLIEGKGSETT